MNKIKTAAIKNLSAELRRIDIVTIIEVKPQMNFDLRRFNKNALFAESSANITFLKKVFENIVNTNKLNIHKQFVNEKIVKLSDFNRLFIKSNSDLLNINSLERLAQANQFWLLKERVAIQAQQRFKAMQQKYLAELINTSFQVLKKYGVTLIAGFGLILMLKNSSVLKSAIKVAKEAKDMLRKQIEAIKSLPALKKNSPESKEGGNKAVGAGSDGSDNPDDDHNDDGNNWWRYFLWGFWFFGWLFSLYFGVKMTTSLYAFMREMYPDIPFTDFLYKIGQDQLESNFDKLKTTLNLLRNGDKTDLVHSLTEGKNLVHEPLPTCEIKGLPAPNENFEITHHMSISDMGRDTLNNSRGWDNNDSL